MAKARSSANDAERLLAVAREIIRETGDFELPMRQLAARAQVSLRAPYLHFGSKAGVIAAILRSEGVAFRSLARSLPATDPLTNLFDRIELAIRFYGQEQAFYRALFRATQAYAGRGVEPPRDVLPGLIVLCRRAQRAGLLRPEFDPAAIGEILSQIFADSVRTWARSDADVSEVHPVMGFGFALTFAATTPAPVSDEMLARAIAFQGAIRPPYATELPLAPFGRVQG